METSPKKIYKWQRSKWKYSQHRVTENCKLKQWNTTTQLLRWLKFETLTRFLGVGMPIWKDTAHLEDNLTVSDKIIYSLNIQSSNRAPSHFTSMSWRQCPNKNLHMKVIAIFFHSCQNLEATKMFFNEFNQWINCGKSIEWCILFSNKFKWSLEQ